MVENGGGYDDFVDQMIGALPAKPQVINAVEVSGKQVAVIKDFRPKDKLNEAGEKVAA